MGPFTRILEHYAVAGRDFARLFRGAELPQLPEAVSCLINELNQDEPDIASLTKVISSDVELSTKVLRTVNSALYGLANDVSSVQNAITLLGLRSIRSIALSYAMKSSVPCPENGLFDKDAFWTDSLVRALMGRSLAGRYCPREQDEAFTASLLSDVALPVLLNAWDRYYEPLIESWRSDTQRLSKMERDDFGWDHAQAGAWILKSWGFSDELVSLVGLHNLSLDECREEGLEHTVAMPVVAAALMPSVLRPGPAECETFIDTARTICSLTDREMATLIEDVNEQYGGIREYFGIKSTDAGELLKNLVRLCDTQSVEGVN